MKSKILRAVNHFYTVNYMLRNEPTHLDEVQGYVGATNNNEFLDDILSLVDADYIGTTAGYVWIKPKGIQALACGEVD